MIYDANYKVPNILIQHASQIPYGDKLGHIVLYGLLAFLVNYALDFKTLRSVWGALQVGALWVLAFAFLEEGSQLFLSTRTFSLADALCDVIGVVLFSYMGLFLKSISVRFWSDRISQKVSVKN